VGSIKEGFGMREYQVEQEKCARHAPITSSGFESLVADRSVVFRDVTPFFALANVLENNMGGKVLLIRPRRWGKSVLGTAWIEFLRGRKDLFEGTWAHDKMRKEKLIGVHVDFYGEGRSANV
jgi:hypothetical protein